MWFIPRKFATAHLVDSFEEKSFQFILKIVQWHVRWTQLKRQTVPQSRTVDRETLGRRSMSLFVEREADAGWRTGGWNGRRSMYESSRNTVTASTYAHTIRGSFHRLVPCWMFYYTEFSTNGGSGCVRLKQRFRTFFDLLPKIAPWRWVVTPPQITHEQQHFQIYS